MERIATARFRVYGIVQGVGFRPTVDRHASASGIRGSVCNKGPYVEIFAQGTPDRIGQFETLLREQPPRRSSILKIDRKEIEDAEIYSSFSIIESEKTDGEIFISPDIAICEECTQELYDPGNRRYLHPFINCTCCGPRLTILDALPYDRERTSMKMFPMCRACEEEYYSPLSRRYDAQPVCCNECGPEVYLLPAEGSKWTEAGLWPAGKNSFSAVSRMACFFKSPFSTVPFPHYVNCIQSPAGSSDSGKRTAAAARPPVRSAETPGRFPRRIRCEP